MWLLRLHVFLIFFLVREFNYFTSFLFRLVLLLLFWIFKSNGLVPSPSLGEHKTTYREKWYGIQIDPSVKVHPTLIIEKLIHVDFFFLLIICYLHYFDFCLGNLTTKPSSCNKKLLNNWEKHIFLDFTFFLERCLFFFLFRHTLSSTNNINLSTLNIGFLLHFLQ